MRKLRSDIHNHVRITFAGTTLSFGLPKWATLQNLAEEVGWLARFYRATPIMVEVRKPPRRR